MKEPEPRQCPACWSALAEASETCPSCGYVLRAPARARRGKWPLAAALLAGAALATLWHRWPASEPGPQESRATSQPIASKHPSSAKPNEVRSPARPSHLQMHVRGETTLALFALALHHARAGTTPLLFLPLALLPLRGTLDDAGGEPIPLAVVAIDERFGFVLLTRTRAGKADLDALRVGRVEQSTELATLRTDGGAGAPVAITGRARGGMHLVIGQELPCGTALIDRSGAAIAYALGGNEALLLDATVAWLSAEIARPLAEMQKELRNRDPQALLEDAHDLMLEAGKSRDPDQARTAIEWLGLALGLARTQELIKNLDEHLLRAWQLRIRLLSAHDEKLALSEIGTPLARFPIDPILLADACSLAAERQQPERALAFYARLLAVSREDAAKAAEALIAAIDKYVRRHPDSDTLLVQAIMLFPQRASFRILRADALARAGRTDEASAEASEAARLDPTFARQAEAFRIVAQRGRTPGTVQIPFDPQTSVISAQVRVGDQALELVVDTGATLTTIPSALADQLQLRRSGNQRVKVNTASGTVEGEVVTLPSLHIGPIEVKNVQAVVLDLPESLAGKGLLGLNVLQRLDMEIDSARGYLVLRQDPRRRR